MSTEITGWFKSSYSSNNNQCVESTKALLAQGLVPVRDSKDLTKPPLVFRAPAFAAFIADVKDGAYDL